MSTSSSSPSANSATSPGAAALRDPQLRHFLTRTVGSPLKLRVLVELAAAHPKQRGLETLTARLGVNGVSVAQALHGLTRQGLVKQGLRDGEVWYALANSAAGRQQTLRVSRLWQQDSPGLLALFEGSTEV